MYWLGVVKLSRSPSSTVSPPFVVPESPLGTLAALGACVAALLVYTTVLVYKRKSRLVST
jgi:hypothetical protein